MNSRKKNKENKENDNIADNKINKEKTNLCKYFSQTNITKDSKEKNGYDRPRCF